MEPTAANEAAAQEFLKLTSPQATGRSGTPQSAEEEEAITERGIHRGMIAGLIRSGQITLAEGLRELDGR